MDRKRSTSEDAIEHVEELGEAIRSQYDLAQPLPDGLYQLVMELDRRSRPAIVQAPRGANRHVTPTWLSLRNQLPSIPNGVPIRPANAEQQAGRHLVELLASL